MKILTVNAGSSSLKFNCIELPSKDELISGYFEKIGMNGSFYTIKKNGTKAKREVDLDNHSTAIKYLIEELFSNQIIKSLDEIDGVGHRLVHGGDKYKESVLITDEVIKTVEELSSLAPLHNPANLIGVRAFKEAMPTTPMVGVFDTAFHQTMEESKYLYPVPYTWYTNHQIRKYGFHGTSHKYITKVMQEKLGKENINIISCHIGSGGSIACIKDGKSMDTTMGFSPNSGIMMGSRCGDIDYSIIPYYMEKTGASLKEVDTILNKQSGLLGISGVSADHRDIEAEIAAGNKQSKLSDIMYIERIVGYIAKYYVALDGKVDALIFTAGLGENAREFRKDIIDRLHAIGLFLDEERNMQIAGYLEEDEGIISSADSRVPIYVVPTNEELMIALDTYEIIK